MITIIDLGVYYLLLHYYDQKYMREQLKGGKFYFGSGFRDVSPSWQGRHGGVHYGREDMVDQNSSHHGSQEAEEGTGTQV
jgi:hypothetical protein